MGKITNKKKGIEIKENKLMNRIIKKKRIKRISIKQTELINILFN